MHTTSPVAHAACTVRFSVPATRLGGFFPLFQQGILVAVRTGISLGEALVNEFCLTPDFIAAHLQTIFLNGSPVDDMETPRLKHGDVLALSEAMPGLLGATMRRDGVFSTLREGITCTEHGDVEQGDGLVVVKLFNMLLGRMIPALFERGVLLSPVQAQEILPHVLELDPEATVEPDGGRAAALPSLAPGELVLFQTRVNPER